MRERRNELICDWQNHFFSFFLMLLIRCGVSYKKYKWNASESGPIPGMLHSCPPVSLDFELKCVLPLVLLQGSVFQMGFFLKRIVCEPLSFSSRWPKYLTQTMWRRKGLFWLMVSEFSVHGWLAPLLNIIMESHGGRKLLSSCSREIEKERKIKGPGMRNTLPGHAPTNDLLPPN